MAFTLSVAAVTVALMISSIIVKPYVNIRRVKIGLYCAVAVAGAAVLLATGSVSVSEAVQECKAQYRNPHTKKNVAGTCLCIAAALPVFVGEIVNSDNDLLPAMMLFLCRT